MLSSERRRSGPPAPDAPSTRPAGRSTRADGSVRADPPAWTEPSRWSDHPEPPAWVGASGQALPGQALPGQALPGQALPGQPSSRRSRVATSAPQAGEPGHGLASPRARVASTGVGAPTPLRRPAGPVRGAPGGATARAGGAGSRSMQPPRARSTSDRGTTRAGSSSGPSALVEQTARIIGVFERREERDPGVEANARLTGTTGLVLAVLFVLEGLTVPFIFQFLSWHIALGLALVPLLAVKIGSTSWRFSRYYLGDPRYRRAGPPHPLLRALGPALLVSTVVMMASGVALWLNGPTSDLLLLHAHQASFVVWFACVAVHFVSHFYRAVRLAAGDSRDAQVARPVLRGARLRRRSIALAFVAGVALAAFGHTVSTGWSHLVFGPVPSHAAPAPAAAPSARP